MESLREKYLNHAMKYNPPTWSPQTTQTASTKRLPTTRRTTTRTLPRQTTSKRFWQETSRTANTRRPTSRWATTQRTTTTMRTKTTTRRTTPTRRTTTSEKIDDYESYVSSSEITKASGQLVFKSLINIHNRLLWLLLLQRWRCAVDTGGMLSTCRATQMRRMNDAYITITEQYV